MQDFKKLLVWQKSQRLIVVCHAITSKIKGAHYTSIRSQIIRCSMSVGANIAEGRAQRSDREFARFIQYSLASANELESHILACRSLNLISEKDCIDAVSIAIEVRRMLHGMRRKLTGDSRA